MSNFQISVNAVLPVFLLMAAGYLSKRAGIIKEENVGYLVPLCLARLLRLHPVHVDIHSQKLCLYLEREAPL